MSSNDGEHVSSSRIGWFTVGALAASLAFVLLMVSGDIFKAVGTAAEAGAEPPQLIIEGE